MELLKMIRDEVVHVIEEDPEVVQTIEKGEGQLIEDTDDDEVGRETGGDGEVEIEEGRFANFTMIRNYYRPAIRSMTKVMFSLCLSTGWGGGGAGYPPPRNLDLEGAPPRQPPPPKIWTLRVPPPLHAGGLSCKC